MSSHAISNLISNYTDALSGSLYANVFARNEPAFNPFQVDWVSVMKFHVDAKYLSVACLAWVTYDWIITFEESVILFWMYRWTISKALFLILPRSSAAQNRYVSIVIMIDITLLIFSPSPSVNDCMKGAWIEFVCSAIIIMVINLMLASRVYALWRFSPIILTVVLVIMLGNIGAYISLYGLALHHGTAIANQLPFTGCFVLPNYPNLWIIFCTSLIFETVAIVLIVIKSYPMARQRDISTPLFTLMLEDGIGYYLCIMTAQLMTLICVYVPSPTGAAVAGSYLPVPVSSVAVNRLFLRLQRILLNKNGLSYETAEFATTGRYGTTDSVRAIGQDTIGGSNSIGPCRRHPQRHRKQEESDWDIELSSGVVKPALERLQQGSDAIITVIGETVGSDRVVPLDLESNPRQTAQH